jgi:threonine/homoserine/homoserine lactone efflux protein
MKELIGLMAFAFVGSASPGPNNTLLWASAVTFGFRRTVPHVVGTVLGIASLVASVAAGIGILIDSIPWLPLALKIAGSAYLFYLAYLVLGNDAIGRAAVSHPLSVLQAVAFQWVNPKAWIFALAAVGTFLPRALHRFIGVALIEGILMAVVATSSSIWAASGAALGRILDDERARRAVSIGLAVLLVASATLVWI